MDDIKIISQKSILKTERFEIKETEIEVSQGKKKTRHDVFRRSTVVVFPLTDSYEIYLISQYRYLYKKNIIDAVAGFIEEGENALVAAKRELKEETGLIATQWEEIARIEMSASAIKATAHLFLAKGLEISESEPEEGEKINLFKVPLAQAVEKVILGEINMSATMVGILLLDKLKKEKNFKNKL